MKKGFNILIILILVLSMNMVFANSQLENEDRFGLAVDYQENNDYPGDIVIEGIYVAQTDTEYVFTLTYEGGELVKMDDVDVPKSSFFNPTSGDTVMISWIDNTERISASKNAVHYRVEKELYNQVTGIGIMLFDVKYNNHEENMSAYFIRKGINYSNVPHEDTLVSAYEITEKVVETNMSSEPASWAASNIEELHLEGLLREDAFTGFSEGITRARFVYLMVNLYEELTQTRVTIDPEISFVDSDDAYVLKAATIGITSGIGDGKFGPDIILNREQMTTFLIKTLKLSGIDLSVNEDTVSFGDDEEMSGWAKDSIYTARTNNIMGGIGDNMFAPKKDATNEQALYITHDLLKTYGDLEWLREFDKNRVYVKFGEDYYRIPLTSNVLVNEDTDMTNLQVMNLEDFEIILNALLLQEKDITFDPSENPNIKGTLNTFDYKKMILKVQNIYLGVDKVGEKTTIDFDGKYTATATERFDLKTVKVTDFKAVKYYNLDQSRVTIDTLPLDEITTALEINYTVSYNKAWEIYVLEVITE